MIASKSIIGRAYQLIFRVQRPAQDPFLLAISRPAHNKSTVLERTVQPEILDSLPEDHPGAIRNRRDILLINRIMGNFRWFRRRMDAHLRPGESILEIGAGAGDLALFLNRERHGTNLHWSGLDTWSRPPAWPANWDWIVEDLTTFSRYGDYPVIVGNLILHQFEPSELRDLGTRWARHARLLVFNEPTRHAFPLFLMQASFLIGMHPISRHDGSASVRAGFRGDELPRMLNLPPDAWSWTLETTLTGSYRMVAQRKS